jgi:tetratricopeptide (TPR) repeat protein
VAPGTAPQPPQEKPAEAIVRLPVPEKEALAKARQDIRHIFSKEFGAADQAEQKSKLAGMLLKQALDTKDDATARYGLFCEARDEALEAADLGRYTKIVKKTAEHYQIDALAIRAGGLRQATKRPHPSSSVTLTLTRLLMQLAEEMTADDRYDEADAMAKLAHELATRYKNYPRAKEAAALRRDVEQVRQFHKAAEDAEKALAQHPDDPAANLLLGKYYCFGRQQWERGLPMLAKGNQETLKALAVAEKTTPANATEMVALGDRWWDAAGSGRVADMQRFVQARAAYWYRLALPDLLGLTMIRIQQRLDEIGR